MTFKLGDLVTYTMTTQYPRTNRDRVYELKQKEVEGVFVKYVGTTMANVEFRKFEKTHTQRVKVQQLKHMVAQSCG